MTLPIFASATPLLKCAVHIIRVSGNNLEKVLAPLCKLPRPKELLRRDLKWRDGKHSFHERALVVFSPAPQSYTGEDCVEFHLHGSPLLVQRFSERLLQLGLRLARPGEFTERALLNGKQSLLEVEALQELMEADTDLQLQQAQAHQGGLPAWVTTFQAELAGWVAQAEATVDYGEDEHVSLDEHALKAWAIAWSEQVQLEYQKAQAAQWVKKGIHVVLVGRPNAGKSSLFNYLLKDERAIVSDTPGTTRDYLEGRSELGDLPLVIFDTAGIRYEAEQIEQAGILKIHKLLLEADLILYLIPAQDRSPDPATEALIQVFKAKVMRVSTMVDQGEPYLPTDCHISLHPIATKGLQQALHNRFLGHHRAQDLHTSFWRDRHLQLLLNIMEALRILDSAPSEAPSEIYASALQSAWRHLCRLTGADPAESSLDEMFKRFCLGK